MRNLAVTGISGFVASRYGAFSRVKGKRVLGLGRSTPAAGSCDEFHLLEGFGASDPLEVENSVTRLAQRLADARVDVLVHLAAEFVGHHSRPAQAISMIDANVRFGSAMLEACRIAGVKRVVAAGTAWQHYHGAVYQPVSLYAATREAFDSIARYYADSEGMQILRLHFYDSFGEGDPRKKLLSILKAHFDQCLTAVRQGRALPAPLGLGPCLHLINLLHSDDIVSAIDHAANAELPVRETFPLYAVRAKESMSVKWVVDEVSTIFRSVSGLELPVDIGALPGRPREMVEDWKFAPTLPGWSPRVGLSDGLRRYLLDHEV